MNKMANFCYDCTKDVLGVDPKWNDFAERQTGLRKVLCEGCGVIVVDYEGKKVDDLLLKFSPRIDEDEDPES